MYMFDIPGTLLRWPPGWWRNSVEDHNIYNVSLLMSSPLESQAVVHYCFNKISRPVTPRCDWMSLHRNKDQEQHHPHHYTNKWYNDKDSGSHVILIIAKYIALAVRCNDGYTTGMQLTFNRALMTHSSNHTTVPLFARTSKVHSKRWGQTLKLCADFPFQNTFCLWVAAHALYKYPQ